LFYSSHGSLLTETIEIVLTANAEILLSAIAVESLRPNKRINTDLLRHLLMKTTRLSNKKQAIAPKDLFARLSEQRMHFVRWILTISWLLLLASLVYDPWTSTLTKPNHPWSLLRLPNTCIQVQGQCLTEQLYPLGTTIFWGAVLPVAIFILLVLGHEVWRRICPLSFLSQISRALGWQRQFKRENKQTGKVRYELAKVKPDSWLGRNYSYLQFGWLFVGLCGRILFFNADRLLLAAWFLFTIGAAITVGYLYGGKSWCNYFCPMAPVQRVYSEPGGLLTSKAHMSDRTITQSMCRKVLSDGKEQSNCIACQTSCIDIDAEKSYWDGLNKPQEPFLRYAYVGLVVGYFGYYYLYAGNWHYYFSGAWARQSDQLASLFSPGLYLFNQEINIPKLFAVPLVLGLSTAIAYHLGVSIEKRAKAYSHRHNLNLSAETIRHRLFTLCTFGVFNFFFIFSGRPLIRLMPLWVQSIYTICLVSLSTLWLYKTWRRDAKLYSRENLASRFRKQLEKLQINVAPFLEGASLSDLNIHEVYVLAKVLPGFTKEKRHQAYQGVVRESLEKGYINYSSSLEVLQQMRQELGITDDEHQQVLEELGIEEPELLDPNHQRSLENQVRLGGYRQCLERLMLLPKKQADPKDYPGLLPRDSAKIRSLRHQFSITEREEAAILSELSPEAGKLKRADFLLVQLTQLVDCYRALNQPILRTYREVFILLREAVHHKKERIVGTILETLAIFQNDPQAISLAKSLAELAPTVLGELLESNHWHHRLHPDTFRHLTQPGANPIACSLESSAKEILSYLEILVQEPNPLIQTAALYAIAQIAPESSKTIARNYLHQSHPLVLRETAEIILSNTKVK
jgi:hypothetical protein